MLTKTEFCQIVAKIQEFENFIERLGQYIMLEKFDELFLPSYIFDLFFKSIYSEKKVDEFNEWFWENGGLNASRKEIEKFFENWNDKSV